MQKLVWKNSIGDEIDLTSGSYGITEWEGFANTSLNIQSQQVPFQDGGVFLDALMEQRELSVTLAMNDGGNLENRYRLRRELIHILNPKLGEGYLIYTNDFISKRIKCVAQIPLFETHNSNDSGTPKASLAWTACEPYWEDLEETSITFSGQESVINNGDVNTPIQIVLKNGSKNPTFINKTQDKSIIIEKELNATTVCDTGSGSKTVIENDIEFTTTGGTNITYKSCAYGQGKYVYVGSVIMTQDIASGKIYYKNNLSANAIIYEKNMFVAVGSSANNKVNVLKSLDGINWNVQEIEITTYIDTNIAYGNGKFVIVSRGKSAVSEDGDNWSIFNVTNYNTTFVGLAYGNGKFVAICGGGLLLVAYYSTDGESWTAVTLYEDGQQEGICLIYDGEDFVILGHRQDSPQNYKYLSTDGVSWNKSELSINPDYDSKLIFADNLYVCIHTDSSGTILTSKDLESWTSISADGNYIAYGIMYATSQFYLCGNYGYIATSKNMQALSKIAGFLLEIKSVCYSKKLEKFCFIGDSVVGLTENGYVYELGESNVTGLKSIVYSDKLQLFCAVGGRYIIISQDGLQWQIVGTYAQGTNLSCITYSEEKGLFCVVGKNIILRSADGHSWNSGNIQGEFYSVAYGNGKFVAVGYNNLIKYSPDCINWQNGNISASSALLSITYGNGKFLCINYNQCFESKDGINFDYRSSLPNGSININYSDNFSIFIITGTNNIELTADGISYNYYVMVQGQNININCSADNNEKILVFGDGIAITSQMQKENIINYLSASSDMSINLSVGENSLVYFDDNNKDIVLKYRQKYIGV